MISYTSASQLILSDIEESELTKANHSRSLKSMRGPCSCAVNKDGLVVVSEWRGHSVSVLSSEGEIVQRFGNRKPSESSLTYSRIFYPSARPYSYSFGSKPGELHEPTGVAITDDNHILVSDSQNHRIQLFSFSGVPVGVTPAPTSEDEFINCPYGIAIDRHGLIYVSNPFKHSISVLTPELSYSYKFGSRGKTPGKFEHPLGVAFDSNNMLYVCDRDNSRIQKLSTHGVPVTTYKVDHLEYPVRVAVDSNGIVYAAYSYSCEIAMFSNDGEYIGRFGGDSEAVSSMKRPRGLTFALDNIYICDTIRDEVLIF